MKNASKHEARTQSRHEENKTNRKPRKDTDEWEKSPQEYKNDEQKNVFISFSLSSFHILIVWSKLPDRKIFNFSSIASAKTACLCLLIFFSSTPVSVLQKRIVWSLFPEIIYWSFFTRATQ